MGQQASEALKQFVETGRGDLLTETRQASVFDEFLLPPISNGGGRSESQFFVDGNHNRVSLITRITPSPDWFIGMDSFQVQMRGQYIEGAPQSFLPESQFANSPVITRSSAWEAAGWTA